MKKVLFYTLPFGKNPITDFLDSLSAKEAQRVTCDTMTHLLF